MFELALTIVYRLERNDKNCQSPAELGVWYASRLTIFPQEKVIRNVLSG